MNTNKTAFWRLFSVIAALVTANVALGDGEGKILVDNSGSVLTSPETSAVTAWSPTGPTITIPAAISSSPVTAESFSKIEYAAPAMIVPVPTNLGPGPVALLAALDEDADPYLLNTEVAPVPEPATWVAGLLATYTLLQVARKRPRYGSAFEALRRVSDSFFRKRGPGGARNHALSWLG